MTTKRSTKRALLSSVLATVLCVAMLIGTTFAWFTDSVTSGKNKIVAGNLDVELNYWDGAAYKNAADVSLFNEDALWEPGHTEVVYLQVKNAGTLALQYQLAVNPDVEQMGINVYGDSFKLSDYLVFSAIEGKNAADGVYTRDEARAAAGAVMGLGKYMTGDVVLEAGAEQYVALVVYMPIDVGNAANYKTGTTPASIDLSVSLVATQTPKEEDSFGSDYDADAAYPFEINGETVYLEQTDNGLYKNAEDPTDETNYVADQSSLQALRELVNVKNSEIAKSDVTLATDVTLDKNWEPIGSGKTSRFSGTFDGGGHQIIDMSAHNNMDYGNAFFGDITGGAVIKNMTFVNADICRYTMSPNTASGNVYGVVAGYTYGDVTFENVHVKDSKLTGFGKVGALIGMAADKSGTTKLINCSVENTVITGAYNCGSFIGLAQNKVEMVDCTTENVTWVKAYGDDQYFDVDTMVTWQGEETPVKGTYWKWYYEEEDCYLAYAAWGDYYTDYYVANSKETIYLTNDGMDYQMDDGFCH